MGHRIKTAVYYLSQLLVLVIAIATGSPAHSDDRLLQITPHPFPLLTTVFAVPKLADLTAQDSVIHGEFRDTH